MRETRVIRIGAALAMATLLLAGCGGSSGGSEPDEPAATTTTKAEVTTTTAAVTTTTTTAAVTTTKASGSSTTAAPTTVPTVNLEPGDPCSMEEGSPDCIDPDGDGEGTYLIGGADCMATAPSPEICTDLDGDGYAGYPDSN